MKSALKILLKFLVAAVLLIAVLNFNYLWKNLVYTFQSEPPASSPEKSTISELPLAANTLSIPSLGIEAPIIEAKEPNEESFQAAATQGVGHYPGTAYAGEFGNVYIFGHSSDNPWAKNPYKTIFALLPQISLGAEVILTGEKGQPFRYYVTEKFVTSKNDLKLLDQYDYKKRMLTLQTSYPLGTSLKRYIVIAEMKE